MSKASELRVLFRAINDGLTQVESLPQPEAVRLIQSLRRINEEMCDYVIDLVKAHERLKTEYYETRRDISALGS